MEPEEANPIWEVLGLGPDCSEGELRRAYARKLKTLDQATQRSEFQELRDAFDQALEILKGRSSLTRPLPTSPPAPLLKERGEALGSPDQGTPVSRPSQAPSDTQAIRAAVNQSIQLLSAGDTDAALNALRALAEGPLCEVFTGRWEAIRAVLSAFDESERLPGRYCLEFLEIFAVDDGMAQSLGRPAALERIFEVRDARLWARNLEELWAEHHSGFRSFHLNKAQPSHEELALNLLHRSPRGQRDRLEGLLKLNNPAFAGLTESILDWVQGLVVDPECLGLHPESVAWWRRRLLYRDWPYRPGFAGLSSLWVLLPAFAGMLLFAMAYTRMGKTYDWLLDGWGLFTLIGAWMTAATLGILAGFAVFSELLAPLFRRLLALQAPRWLGPAVALATSLPLALAQRNPMYLMLSITAMTVYAIYGLWGTAWIWGWVFLAGLAFAFAVVAAEGKPHLDQQGWVDVGVMAAMWAVYFVIHYLTHRKPKLSVHESAPEPKAEFSGFGWHWITWIVIINVLRAVHREDQKSGANNSLYVLPFLVALGIWLLVKDRYNWRETFRNWFGKKTD